MAFGRGDDLHLLPVVCEFLSAIEAGNVGTRKSSSLGASFGVANCDREAITRMSTAEKRFDQFCNHNPPSIPSGVCPNLGSTCECPPLHSYSDYSSTHLLRFTEFQKGLGFPTPVLVASYGPRRKFLDGRKLLPSLEVCRDLEVNYFALRIAKLHGYEWALACLARRENRRATLNWTADRGCPYMD